MYDKKNIAGTLNFILLTKLGECMIYKMTEEEIKVLKDYWTGQMSDGWGEGFEQRPIDVEDGEIYVSFWNSADFWNVLTEEELMGGQVQGMDLCC